VFLKAVLLLPAQGRMDSIRYTIRTKFRERKTGKVYKHLSACYDRSSP